MIEPEPRGEGPLKYAEEPSSAPRVLLMVILLAAVAGAGYFLWRQLETHAPPAVPAQRPASPAAPKAEPEPAVRYPLEAEGTDTPLPSLQDSDALMRELVSGILGARVFDALVQPKDLARHIVATVDNLPRRTVPTRISAHKPPPGAFVPGPVNQARYAAYVRALESVDARAVVERYRKAYPLFQQAYAELGFPDRYFNDRLVEAIDDMLAAPDLAGEAELVQPKVFYQYTDPALEMRSAGQKVMMRIGAANAAKVRAKLREIRAELAKGGRKSGMRDEG